MRGFRILLVLPLAACAPDYTAVRDWASQARDATLPIEVARAPRPPVAPVPATPVTLDGQAGAVLALQEGAAAWLGMLAFLADDGWPLQRENPLTDLVAKVQPYDAEGAAALKDLGDLMAHAARRDTRAPWLSTAVERSNPSFQKVIAALQRQSAAIAAAAPPAPRTAPPRNLPPAQRALAEEVAATRRAEADRQRMAQDARVAALVQVAEGHAFLAAHKDALSKSDTARLIRVQEQELRRLVLLGVAG
ncbi:hypothetical protein [Roseomonas sp. AR75]|uniref:hypothetical protein n=1 Tax=Roseomonas sp. AR75 TaxID=2562311 RepID=UPI0010BFCA8F|nr:hypothetical protein [Roseomonas sp. AR75]